MASKGTVINQGEVLQDRYRILYQIDSGADGDTYLAEDINLKHKYYVLKRVASQLVEILAKKDAQKVFEQEVGFCCHLQHAQIPKYRELLHYENEEKQYLFWIRDYVQGYTYQKLLDQRLEKNQKFQELEIKVLLKNILPVLDYLHSMGVIHSNISPESIILREEDQQPVLINFGCIKKAEKQVLLLSQTPINGAVDKTLPFVGTALEIAGFAPREQVQLDISHPHNDLYALAATAVVLLTGKEPVQLVDLAQYRWNWQSEVNIDSRLELLLDKMLSSNPAERIDSAAEVIKILNHISGKDLSPTSSPVVRSATKLQLLLPILKAQIESFLLLQSFSKKMILLSLLTTGLFITYAYPKQLAKLPGFSTKSPTSGNSSNSLKANDSDNSVISQNLQSRFSMGETVLIPQQFSAEKKNASQAFARGDYAQAASLFSTSLKLQPNDPEALIYFSNALIGEKTSYTIAVPVPIGKNVNSAKEILRGVAQAQSQINQRGGINKIPLKIQIIDDNNSVDVAQKVAQSLCENPNILGVIGHYTSDVTLATAKIYENNNLAAISPISSSVKLSNYSPYVFRTVPSDYIAAKSLAQYVRYQRQKRKVAVFFNSQSDHSESLKLEFRSALAQAGGQVVGVFDFANPNFDVAMSFEQAVDNGAEVLMLSTNPEKLDKALQVIQVNNRQLELLGGDDIYTAKTLQIAGKSAENMVLAVPWNIKHNSNSDFLQMAEQLWRGKISWRTAMAYDATQAWISAIEKNQRPTRMNLQKTLANPGFSSSGANQEIRFLRSGDRQGNTQLVKIKQADNDFGYEFIPLPTSSPISL